MLPPRLAGRGFPAAPATLREHGPPLFPPSYAGLPRAILSLENPACYPTQSRKHHTACKQLRQNFGNAASEWGGGIIHHSYGQDSVKCPLPTRTAAGAIAQNLEHQHSCAVQLGLRWKTCRTGLVVSGVNIQLVAVGHCQLVETVLRDTIKYTKHFTSPPGNCFVANIRNWLPAEDFIRRVHFMAYSTYQTVKPVFERHT
mmetsp:Transcript_56085/g.122880  ORF Transcript_56085/g.122880 Transcript_56085/m.122880 type:complete len:200 (+) Transcript_56085:835-1434(+)